MKLGGKRRWALGAAVMVLGLALTIATFGLPGQRRGPAGQDAQGGCCYGPMGTLYCDPIPKRWFECCDSAGLQSPWLALLAFALFARRRARVSAASPAGAAAGR